MATRCVCVVCCLCSRRSGARNWRVEEWAVAGSSLFGPVVCHGPGVTALDRLRPGNSGARVPAAWRLGTWKSRTEVRPSDSAAPLYLLSVVFDGTAGENHSLAAFGGGDDRATVDLLANFHAHPLPNSSRPPGVILNGGFPFAREWTFAVGRAGRVLRLRHTIRNRIVWLRSG